MWNLLQIELFKIFKRPRTYIAFVAITVIVLLIQLVVKFDGKNFLDLFTKSIDESFEFDKSSTLNGYLVCYFILNTLLVQVPILVALIAGDTIAGEANMGTLRLLISKPIGRTRLLLTKFAACAIYTFVLLCWMALLALVGSILLFGVNDLMVSRVINDQLVTLLITSDDILWRYMAAFSVAAVALITVASLAFLFSIFAENAVGPIVASVSVVIVFTILSNLNIPLIDHSIKPWLFTSHMVAWKGFFYINFTDDGETIKGSLQNWPAIRNSLLILVANIFVFITIAILVFRKKDILS